MYTVATPIPPHLPPYPLRAAARYGSMRRRRPTSVGPSPVPMNGLGYDVVIGTPLGNQTISIPLEAMSKTMGKQAADAAWTELQPKLEAEVTHIMKQVTKMVDTQVDVQTNKVLAKVGSSATGLATPALLVAIAAIGVGGWYVYQKKKRAA